MFIKNIKYLFIFITILIEMVNADIDLQKSVYDSAEEMMLFDEKMNRMIAEHNGEVYEEDKAENQIIDFEETQKGYLLERFIKDATHSKIELKLENRRLTILIKRRIKEKVEDETGISYETTVTESSSSLYLPSNADAKTMKDSFVDGILKIEFKKIEE